jgi:hypothetical protein
MANFAKLQDFESARAVTMLLTAGWRVPKPSIPAVPALAQQSHTADEQKATEEHATPDIKTEKPAIGQSYKSHGCPLLGNAARPPPRALGLEPAAEVTERANTGIFKHASGHSIVAKGHFAFANMARHYRSAALRSTRPWRRTDSYRRRIFCARDHLPPPNRNGKKLNCWRWKKSGRYCVC